MQEKVRDTSMVVMVVMAAERVDMVTVKKDGEEKHLRLALFLDNLSDRVE